MNATQWKEDAARSAGEAQSRIAQARAHIYALRCAVELSDAVAPGMAVRIAYVLSDLDTARRALENMQTELKREVAP